jgi:hypothetical protein
LACPFHPAPHLRPTPGSRAVLHVSSPGSILRRHVGSVCSGEGGFYTRDLDDFRRRRTTFLHTLHELDDLVCVVRLLFLMHARPAQQDQHKHGSPPHAWTSTYNIRTRTPPQAHRVCVPAHAPTARERWLRMRLCVEVFARASQNADTHRQSR